MLEGFDAIGGVDEFGEFVVCWGEEFLTPVEFCEGAVKLFLGLGF